MVERDGLDAIRTEICATGPASDDDDLLSMEIDCCVYSGDPPYAADNPELWQDMKVRRSEGLEWLVSGRAVGERKDAPAIAEELSAIRDQRLRYRYRSAYTVSIEANAVTLRAVTQTVPDSLWVTADVQLVLS